jgi:hypothetical protein
LFVRLLFKTDRFDFPAHSGGSWFELFFWKFLHLLISGEGGVLLISLQQLLILLLGADFSSRIP